MKLEYKKGLRCAGCGKEIPPGERKVLGTVGKRGALKLIADLHDECFLRAFPKLGDPLALLRRREASVESA